MKTFSMLFAAVGLVLLAITAFLVLDTRSFIATSTETSGTVIDLVPVRSDNGVTYRPVVRFRDKQGQTIEFSSSSSSNPPGYSRGETITVLYRPSNAQDARINGYFSLWGGATIVGGLGTVFALVGGGIMLGGRIIRQQDDALRRSGTPIETDFQSVQLNTSIRINGRHPFCVFT